LAAPERRRLLARRMHVGVPVDDHGCLTKGLSVVVPAIPAFARTTPRMLHVLPYIFAACARSSSSFTSVPQPGPVGSTISPFSITGGWVRSFGFHGTSSTSYSLMRRLGTTAATCPQMIADYGPLK